MGIFDSKRKGSSRFEDDDESVFKKKKRSSSRFEDDDTESVFKKKKRSSSRFKDDDDDDDVPFSRTGKKAKEEKAIRTLMSGINTDMKGFMTTIVDNYRKRVPVETVAENLSSIDTKKNTIDLVYDEDRPMCPALIISSGSGSSVGKSFGKGLYVNGERSEKETHSLTPLENKLKEMISAFDDIKQLLSYEMENDISVKITVDNCSIELMSGTLFLKPSMLLLNVLKDDIKKVSN